MILSKYSGIKKGFAPILIILGILVLLAITGTSLYLSKTTLKKYSVKSKLSSKTVDKIIGIYPSSPLQSKSTISSSPSPISDLTLSEKNSLNVVSKNSTVSTLQTTINTIKINGDQDCQLKTQQALTLLKDKAPVHYANITKYIGIIECVEKGSGMYAYENPPRYIVGKVTIDAGTIWYAGTIAHDANHSKLYHDYKSAHPSESVPENIWTGSSAEAQCLDVQYDALSKIGASQSVLDYIKSVKDTKYWDVPYQNRWW